MRTRRSLRRDDRGATAIEYGLIAALVVVALLGGLSRFASNGVGLFQTVNGAVSNNM